MRKTSLEEIATATIVVAMTSKKKKEWKKLQKITLMWGTPQNFLLAFTCELWKTPKNRILKKWKKIAGDITILHMCTKYQKP